VFARTKYEPFVIPQLIGIRGISEDTWERKRPIWEGDRDRERVAQRKRLKTKHDECTDSDADAPDEENLIEDCPEG
jgi:hypothetical protein